MEQQYFEEGDRVVSRREIKPFRKDGRKTIYPRTPGTITGLWANMACVEFDTVPAPVTVRLSEIDLLSSDEQLVISWGFWPNGGSDD